MLLTFADSNPPDVLQSAGTLAVNTLNLVFSNDHVLQRSSVCNAEDCIGVTALSLASAAYTTAVGLEITVEGAGDHLRRREGHSAVSGGNGNGGAIGDTGAAERRLGGRAGVGHGGESQDGSSDGSLHSDVG